MVESGRWNVALATFYSLLSTFGRLTPRILEPFFSIASEEPPKIPGTTYPRIVLL